MPTNTGGHKAPANKAKKPAATKAPKKAKRVTRPAVPTHREEVAGRSVNGPGRVGEGGALIAPEGGE